MQQPDTNYLAVVPKVWGTEKWIVNNDLYCAKFLVLKPGAESSYHYHPRKDETFHVLEGSCILNLNGAELKLGQGETVRIQPGVPHSFWTGEPKGCLILEVSTSHDESDVVRLHESHLLVTAPLAEECSTAGGDIAARPLRPSSSCPDV